MITPGFVQTMARYNRWQNSNLYGAADALAEADRVKDRGAFFGSVHETLCHILWGDTLWMRLLDGWDAAGDGPGVVLDWAALIAARQDADTRIINWADRVDAGALQGDLTWYSRSVGQDMARPVALCITHLFTHQTHHRGQVHAMLTAAGATPDATDLVFMPEEA